MCLRPVLSAACKILCYLRIVAAVFKVLMGAGLGMPCTTLSTEACSSPPVCRMMTDDKLQGTCEG